MLLGLIALVLAGGATIPADAGCVCHIALERDVWCDEHQVGYLASIPIPSKRLFETMDAHGHDLDLDSFKCDVCQRAIRQDGFCAEHRVGFVEGKVYFSRLTHVVAQGERRIVENIECPVGRENAEDLGWCEQHGVGMVGNVAVKNRRDFDDAVEAVRILRIAIAAAERCVHCADAIVTDTTCPFCRIRYSAGEPVTTSPD